MSVCRPISVFAMTVAVFVAFTSTVTTVEAHTVFKKALEKSYKGVKVSCNACHLKGKPKSERNEGLGKVFYEQLKELKLTEEWKTKKGKEKTRVSKGSDASRVRESSESRQGKEKRRSWRRNLGPADRDG